MVKILKYAVYFILLAGVGVLIGCYIHGSRVNQTMVMSGVAFVRELPLGERTVGLIETLVFSYQEKRDLEKFEQEHKGKIQIDPEQLKRQQELFERGTRSRPGS